MIRALAVALGLLLRNPYRAQGIMALASWALVFLSPMHQSIASLSSITRALLLLNPVTHALNMLRPYLGFEAIAPPVYSFIYAAAVILIVLPFLRQACGRITIIERFF
jgi:ABC-type polysaccharide/polyol phosphate export permease